MDLNCFICCEPYTTNGLGRPRVLPCSHSLCGVCATKLFTNRAIHCPKCKEIHEFPELEKITINRDLIDVIEFQAAEPPKAAGPNISAGICEKHGDYKVHYCTAHTTFICGDCVVADHLDTECHFVPIGKVLNDRKGDTCMKIDLHVASLKETSRNAEETDRQVKHYDDMLMNSQLLIKSQVEKLKSDMETITTQIDKLQSDEKALLRQRRIFQNSASTYMGLVNDCEDHLKLAEVSRKNVQHSAAFADVDNAIKWVESSENKKQNWNNILQATLKQCIGEMFKSGTIGSFVTSQEMYATHTHEEQQRWGKIVLKDGNVILQDFKTDKPTNEATVISLTDVAEYLPSQRYVYFSFNTNNTLLGMVIMRVNENVSRRAEQLIDLCIGHMGFKYSGSSAISVSDKGKPHERLTVNFYLTANLENSDEKLFPDLEETTQIDHKKGLVVTCGEDRAGFRILTRKMAGTISVMGPAIGEIVSGMSLLQNIIGDDLVERNLAKSQVTISESGLVINSNC